MNLIRQVQPQHTLQTLVLSPAVEAQVKTILEDFEFRAALLANGIDSRRRILLHGPSGCGKTSLVHALAHALRLNFVQVSCAQITSKFQGEAEKNIEDVLFYAANNACVLLLDEFDGIASSRSYTESSTSKTESRIVNTFLTGMETLPPLGLIVACTNFPNVIDKAIMRRFDVSIELPPVSRDVLLDIADSIIRGRFGVTPEEVVAIAATPAEVVKCATDKIRRKIIHNEKMQRAKMRVANTGE